MFPLGNFWPWPRSSVFVTFELLILLFLKNLFFNFNFKVTQKLNGGLLRSNEVNWNLFQDIFEKQFNYCVIPKNIKPTKIKIRINFEDRKSGPDRPWWIGPVVIFGSNDSSLLTCIVCFIARAISLEFKKRMVLRWNRGRNLSLSITGHFHRPKMTVHFGL